MQYRSKELQMKEISNDSFLIFLINLKQNNKFDITNFQCFSFLFQNLATRETKRDIQIDKSGRKVKRSTFRGISRIKKPTSRTKEGKQNENWKKDGWT